MLIFNKDFGLGTMNDQGGVPAVIEELNVTPSISAQTITAPTGVDGYNPVNVSAVTSSIDANIQAGNIKSGVSILGVAGTLESVDTITATNKSSSAIVAGDKVWLEKNGSGYDIKDYSITFPNEELIIGFAKENISTGTLKCNVLYGGTESSGIMTSYTLNETRIPSQITIYKNKSFEGVWRVFFTDYAQNANHIIQADPFTFYIRPGSNNLWGVFYVDGSDRYSLVNNIGNKVYNKWIWLKIAYSPVTYLVSWQFSYDGLTWETIHTYNLTNTWFINSSDTQTNITLYTGTYGAEGDWNGYIDFNNSYFKVDDEYVWKGTTVDAGGSGNVKTILPEE